MGPEDTLQRQEEAEAAGSGLAAKAELGCTRAGQASEVAEGSKAEAAGSGLAAEEKAADSAEEEAAEEGLRDATPQEQI